MPDTAPFVGFTTGPAIDNPDQQSLIGTMPSTVTDRFSSELFGASRWLLDWGYRGQMEEQAGASARARAHPDLGYYVPAAPPAVVPKDQLEQKYGITGTLKFDRDMPEAEAQNLYEGALDRLRREDIARRAPSGFFPGAARIGASFVASGLDPLNVAAAFIPVVGEARYARWLAEAGGAGGRAAIRAGVGAARGVAGTVPLLGIHYGIAQETQEDYTAVNALVDLAYGAALGGAMHTALGPFTERGMINEARARLAREGLPGATEPTPLSRSIAAAPLEVREGAMRAAISAGAEDRPTASADVLHTAGVALPGEGIGTPEVKAAIRDVVSKPVGTKYEVTLSDGTTLVGEFQSHTSVTMNGQETANVAFRLGDGNTARIPEGNVASIHEAPVDAELGVKESPGAQPVAKEPGAVPAWLQGSIDEYAAIGQRMGINDAVSELAAQGKTAAEITRELSPRFPNTDTGDLRIIVMAVRNKLGIPSRATAEGEIEFQAWKSARDQATASRAAESVRAAGEPPLGPPGTPLKDPAEAAVQQQAEALAPKGGPRTATEPEPTKEYAEIEKQVAELTDAVNKLPGAMLIGEEAEALKAADALIADAAERAGVAEIAGICAAKE